MGPPASRQTAYQQQAHAQLQQQQRQLQQQQAARQAEADRLAAAAAAGKHLYGKIKLLLSAMVAAGASPLSLQQLKVSATMCKGRRTYDTVCAHRSALRTGATVVPRCAPELRVNTCHALRLPVRTQTCFCHFVAAHVVVLPLLLLRVVLTACPHFRITAMCLGAACVLAVGRKTRDG